MLFSVGLSSANFIGALGEGYLMLRIRGISFLGSDGKNGICHWLVIRVVRRLLGPNKGLGDTFGALNLKPTNKPQFWFRQSMGTA